MSIFRLLVVLTSTALAAAPVANPIHLAPGSALLRLDRITPSVDSTFIRWSMNGQERAGPIQIESVRRITRDGGAVLEGQGSRRPVKHTSTEPA